MSLGLIFIVALASLLSMWAVVGAITWILFEWFDGRAWRHAKKRLAHPIHPTRRRSAWPTLRSTQIPYRGDRA